MSERHTILDSIRSAFVPIHPEGHKFIAGFAVAALILFLLAPPLGWLGVIATLLCAYFFRDPERVTPQRPGLVVSAADGKLVNIGTVRSAEGACARRGAAHPRLGVSLGARRACGAGAGGWARGAQHLRAGEVPECRARQGERGE